MKKLVFLVACGFLVCANLLYRDIAISRPSAGDSFDLCAAVLGASCDASLQSPLANQFQIPLAGWGLIYYCLVATLLCVGRYIGDSFEAESRSGAFLLSLSGAAVSSVLLVGGFHARTPSCIPCSALHIINLALPYAAWKSTHRPVKDLASALVGAGRYVFGREAADPVQARWKTAGFFMVALVAVVLYQWILIETGSSDGDHSDARSVLAIYELLPVVEVPVGADDPHEGRWDAPVRLVVFTDFQCPYCRLFAQNLDRIRSKFAGKLLVVAKHFPLGRVCNPFLKSELHPQACAAAWAAEAAHRQGAFWPYQGRLFNSDLLASEGTLGAIAQASGLDLERWEADRNSPEVRTKISGDIELGRRLGLAGTPSVFLNGRMVQDLSLPALEMLIKHELARKTQPD